MSQFHYNYSNNEKLAESGFALDGKTINGYVTENGVTINVNSAKYLNSVVGHEVTHVLEGTDLYDALQEAVESYAKSKKSSNGKFANEYLERLYNTRQLYENVEGYEGAEGYNKIKQEVVADLVGDYLFTDSDFVHNLSVKNKNLFQKLFDEIKYLCKIVTAGSKEARQLEQVKKAFEDAYRNTKTKTNTAQDGGVRYSLLSSNEKDAIIKENTFVGSEEDGDQHTELLERREVSTDGGSRDGVRQQGGNSAKLAGYLGLLEGTEGQAPTGCRAGESGWILQKDSAQSSQAGYDVSVLRRISRITPSGRDTIGRIVSSEIVERFRNTVFKDEKGNLLSLYHWTQNLFDQFAYGEFGFHFGTLDSAHDRYITEADIRPNAPHGIYKEVYANITNPIELSDDAGEWSASWVAQQLCDKGIITEHQYDLLSMTTGFYEPTYDNPAAEAVRRILEQNGYDGIIYRNKSEDIGSISVIALSPDQILTVAENGVLKENNGVSEAGSKEPAFSLSTQDDPAPVHGDLHISGKDVAIDFGSVREDLMTSQTSSALEGVPIGGEVEQDVLDSEQGAEYNNNRGDTYARTDEFRRLQEESQRMSDEEVQEYHSGRELDPEVRGRLSRAFKLELRSGGSKRNYSIRSLLNPKTNKTVGLVENVDGSLFHDVFEMAQKYLENGELVDVHGIETTEEGIGYNDCYNYLSEDGLSGFSITPDGDLISVFNLSGERGFLKTIAPIVKERAKTLDCYASPKQNLQKMYEAIFGFKTASIMDYNMEYDHDNIADNHDMPQVAFMVNTEDNVVPHSFTKDQYDEAVEYRNSFINGATTQMAATSAGGLQASQIAHGKKTSSKDGVFFAEGLPQQKSRLPMDPNRAVDVELVFDGRKQRRWVKTSTESDVVDGKVLQEDLDPVLTTYQPISNKATVEKANSMLDRMGYDDAITYFKGKLFEGKTSVQEIAMGERLIQEAIRRGDTDTAADLIMDISILGTELGQKVQALSIIKKLTPEGQLRMLQKLVDRGKAKGDKAYEGVEITSEMSEKILSVYDQDGSYDQAELNKAVEEVKQEIANNMKSTFMEKVNTWRYLSMLGNPKTHIRNIVSNVAMFGTWKVKNAFAKIIEGVTNIKNRTKTWRPATKEVRDYSKQVTNEMKSVFGDSGGKYSNEADIKAKRNIFSNKNPLGWVVNKLSGLNSSLLSGEDVAFKTLVFRQSFRNYLTANGIRTSEDIENNPGIVEKAKQYALQEADVVTFQQYSFLANKLSEIERKNVLTQIALGAVMPFKKTPINIAKAGLSYSPLGLAKTLTYDIVQVKKGNMDAATLVDHLAQNLTGTGLTVLGFALASMGILNGAGEDDEEGEYDYQLGEQAYSINIGDKTYSLSWLSPAAMPMLVGANAYEQLVEGKDWNFNVVVDTLAKTLDPLSEMSFISGLDDVLSSYDTGTAKIAGATESMAQNYITQMIPTALSQVASVTDDKKRSTKPSGNSGFTIGEQTWNQIKYKIPGLRQTLEPATDIWGNEVEQNDNLFLRGFESFIAPYSVKEDISTDVDDELLRLYKKTGESGILPNVPRNYISYDGEKYKMSASEYTEYKKTYGQTAYKLMEDLIETDYYKNATDEERADMVANVYDYARELATLEYLEDNGVDFYNATKDGEEYFKENSVKGAIENDMGLDEFDLYVNDREKYDFLQDSGISFEEYSRNKEEYDYAYKYPENYAVAKAVGGYDSYKTYSSDLYDIHADKDSNGKSISGSRKAKVFNYINNLDVNYYTKIILWKSEYPSDDTYNYEILDYLNSREDLSYEEKIAVVKALDFNVDSAGNISW